MSLSDIRKKIDEIDRQLLPLFVERMQCAEQVADEKRKQGLPIYNAERENEILDRVAWDAGAFGIEAKMLYTVMMSLSRMRQHKLMTSGAPVREEILSALDHSVSLDALTQSAVVSCVGEGSYANEAARKLFPGRKIRYLSSHNEIFDALDRGACDIGIVPVENSSAGSVADAYDLIMKYRFSIIAAETVQVCHCLAAPPGASLDTLRTVTSHPQALSQCSETVKALGIRPVQFANTATAAKAVSQQNDITCGVICSKTAAEKYGLRILRENIQNNPHNRTRFVALKKQMVIPTDAGKISLCFSLAHETGTLYSVLSRFAMHGLNLTKIESRPQKGATEGFQYDFYLDFDGSVRENQTLDLLCELSSELNNFSFLGNYRET